MKKISITDYFYIQEDNRLTIISFLDVNKKQQKVKLTLNDMSNLLSKLAEIKFGDEIKHFSRWSPTTTVYYCGEKQALLFKPNGAGLKQMTTLETLELIAYAKNAVAKQDQLAA